MMSAFFHLPGAPLIPSHYNSKVTEHNTVNAENSQRHTFWPIVLNMLNASSTLKLYFSLLQAILHPTDSPSRLKELGIQKVGLLTENQSKHKTLYISAFSMSFLTSFPTPLSGRLTYSLVVLLLTSVVTVIIPVTINIPYLSHLQLNLSFPRQSLSAPPTSMLCRLPLYIQGLVRNSPFFLNDLLPDLLAFLHIPGNIHSCLMRFLLKISHLFSVHLDAKAVPS